MTITRGLAVAVLLACSAVGFAGPASAQPLSGSYFVASEVLQDGGFTWVFTSCGSDCVSEKPGNQLRRQGTVWVGTTNSGCVTSIDENSLAGTYQCPTLPAYPIQLTKM
jgi:hypothetical protein